VTAHPQTLRALTRTPDVTPSQAITFALHICGVHPGRGMVAFILHAIEVCGYRIVKADGSSNVVPLKKEGA